MLGEKPELLKERNQEGFTPLHIACREGLPECVQAFLCAGQVFNILIFFAKINYIFANKSIRDARQFYAMISHKKGHEQLITAFMYSLLSSQS